MFQGFRGVQDFDSPHPDVNSVVVTQDRREIRLNASLGIARDHQNGFKMGSKVRKEELRRPKTTKSI